MGNQKNNKEEDAISLIAGIEKRVEEQLRRHSRINPDTNPMQVIEIQIKQELEELKKMKQIEEEKDDPDPGEIHLLNYVINWLPEATEMIKKKYR